MSGVRLRFVVPVAVLLLAACGEDAAPEAVQGGSASGEVLPGSLSDDMIPTDSLRSQGPQIVEQPTGAANGAAGAAGAADPAAPDGEEAAAADEAEAAPEPEAAAE